LADTELGPYFDEGPRKYTILRQFWHVWRAKTIRRRTRSDAQVEVAERHYRLILLPLTFETWKQKWRYFAVLERRVERDHIRTILVRCLDWWKYKTNLVIQQNERIHNEVVLRRMFKAWLGHVLIKQQQLNTLTLSHVMERWKAMALTTRDLYAKAEHWSRQRVLRQFWKEWFFRTCSVKTVQYYMIKLKQRALAKWMYKIRLIREMNRRAAHIRQKTLLKLAWAKWDTAAQSIVSREERANRHWGRRAISASFRTWRRNRHLFLGAGLFGDKMDNKLISRCWARWRELTYQPL